jgi:hypothetical protein
VRLGTLEVSYAFRCVLCNGEVASGNRGFLHLKFRLHLFFRHGIWKPLFQW